MLMHRVTVYSLMAFFMAVAQTASGDEIVTTPKLVGERENIAMQLAGIAGLKYQTGEYYISATNWRPDLRQNIVYMQNPQPGTLVPAGAVISTWKFVRADENRRIVEMPDVSGEDSEKASRELRELGLKVFELQADYLGDSSVVDQYPTAGKKVFAGTAVLISVKVVPDE